MPPGSDKRCQFEKRMQTPAASSPLTEDDAASMQASHVSLTNKVDRFAPAYGPSGLGGHRPS